MSFLKKAARKIVDFIKEYWVEIAVVALVVFTAGVATIGGWGAFTTVANTQGFMSAIGSTMWAGVTGTAGSMGIGTGAKGAAAAQMSVSGGGLGAGLGWGTAGKGLGITAAEYSANVAAQGGVSALSQQAGDIAYKSAIEKGASREAALAAQSEATNAAATQIGGAPAAPVHGWSATAKQELGKQALKEGAPTVAGEGMSTGEALMWSSAISTGANAAQGMMQGKMYEDAQPKASWLVDLTGKNPYTGPLPGSPSTLPGVQAGPAALQAPGPSLTGAVSNAEAGALFSTRAPFAPLMSASEPYRPAPAPSPEQPLMGGGVPA